MAALADFAKRVTAALQACPLEVAVDACREAAIEFAEKTQLLKTDLLPINIFADEDVYKVFVETVTTVADLDFTASSGTDTTIGSATTGLPVLSAGDLIRIADHSIVGNEGAYQVLTAPSQAVITARKLEGPDPVDAVAESADVRAENKDRRIVSPYYATSDGIPIRALSEEQADYVVRNWRNGGGPVLRAFMEDAKTLRLTWLPNTTVEDGLLAGVITKPTQTAINVDDRLFDDWRIEIEAGAMAILLRIPDKPWSEYRQTRPGGPWHRAANADQYERTYRNGISSARMVAEKSRTNSSSQVQQRPFEGVARSTNWP